MAGNNVQEVNQYDEIVSNIKVLFHAHNTMKQNIANMEARVDEKMNNIQSCINTKIFDATFITNAINTNNENLLNFQQHLRDLESSISDYNESLVIINNLQQELDNSENSQFVIDIITEKLQYLNNELNTNRDKESIQQEIEALKISIANCEHKRTMLALLL
jgi:hypothetical protein